MTRQSKTTVSWITCYDLPARVTKLTLLFVSTAMEVDQPSKTTKSKAKGKIVKRRGRKSNIVFPKFGERKNKKR